MSSSLQPKHIGMSHWNPNRRTVWPGQMDIAESMEGQWLEGSHFQQNHKRWTGAFDNEARASRMSFMVGNTLLPQSTSTGQQWPESRTVKRSTWLSPLQKSDSEEQIWQGEFEVERRPSFSSHIFTDFEKDFEKPSIRFNLNPDQLAQAKEDLISEAVLEYPYKGHGTTASPYLVHWIPSDVGNPMNFTPAKKWSNAMILAFAIFMVSIASSGFSQGTYFTVQLTNDC
jgi:hypothetical protein